MADTPAVMLLDDGELDDVQEILEGLRVAYGRVRGGAIVSGTTPPRDVLISTPRRIDSVRVVNASDGAGPVRVVVVNEDSNGLRDQLRRVGFDYLVRRPVHPEALRLLLMHCLYKGEERRREPRVAVGVEISFRMGLINRRATLADLSIRGCRLLSHTRIEEGRRIKVHIPEALDAGDPFTVTGRVVRASAGADEMAAWTAAVQFDKVSDEARHALELIIEDRAEGPATLRSGATRPTAPTPEPVTAPRTPGAQPAADRSAPQTPLLQVDVSLAPEPESTERAEEKDEPPDAGQGERRRNRRGSYAQTVPAFGDRALRVLVGRDLGVGGMRIERLPGLELGDRLHLAIYGDAGESPFLVWGTVARDDGETGMALVFDKLDPMVGRRLERLVGCLPAVESLHDSEIEAMGTVMTEIMD
jgi:hypothetical protein